MKRLFAAIFLSALLAFGQSERGNITGVVTDASGAKTFVVDKLTLTEGATLRAAPSATACLRAAR